ncbi:MAG: glycosyltransferase [Microbacterium sp.]
MTDLVVVSLERWDDVWRRNQYLVDGLLRADPTLRVLFVEPAADPTHDVVSRRTPSWGLRARPLGDSGRLWNHRPVKWLPRRIDPRADERLAGNIARAAAKVGFHSPILWINDPGMAPLMHVTGWPTLYDITDDWLAAQRPAAELVRLSRGEASLLENAIEVVACSPELVRRKSPARQRERHPIVLIRHAVDVAAYAAPRMRPSDLPAGAALYVGTVHSDRFDVDLTASAARALAGSKTIVLLGPNLLPPDQTARLTRAGVVLLGPRAHTDVPAYLQHADLLIVPHLVTSFTDSLDPLKLYEYLAVGRPVVSTPVAGFVDAGPPVRVASGPAFIAALSDAPEVHGTPALPVAVDWTDRVAAVRQALDRMAVALGTP